MAMIGRTEGVSQVYIAHVAEDAEWAESLRRDFESHGIDSVLADDPSSGSTLLPPLSLGGPSRSAALITLITPASYDSVALFQEIGQFEAAREAEGAGDAPIFPIVFGAELAERMIERIRMRRYLLVPHSVYESKEFSSADWERTVKVARRAVTEAIGELSRGAEEPAPEPLEQVLGRAIIDVGGLDRAGWLFGDDLAVLPAGLADLQDELRIGSESGATQGVVSAWSYPPAAVVHDMALIRLDPVLELANPFPVDLPEAGSPVEFFDGALRRAAGGSVGEKNPDGSFNLNLKHGKITRGPAIWAAWDVMARRYLGLASRTADGGLHLFPLTTLREMAGKPAQSAAVKGPTTCIHADSWTIEDRLDYALYGRAIKEFVEHPDTKPPLVIGVQGPWGQGKTSLMRIAQDRLDDEHADLVARRQATNSPVEGPSEMTLRDLRDSLDGDIQLEGAQTAEVRSVWFNPWKYQNSEALWAGMAHAILTQLPARLSRREQELFWLKLQLHRINATAVRRDIHRLIFDRLLPLLALSVLIAAIIGLACLVIGASAALGTVSALAGGAATAAISWLLVSRRALNGKLEGSYLRYVRQPDYEGKMGYLHHVEEDVRAALRLLTRTGRPTVIFIDDLDRCGPTKISEVLEAINLFLSGDYPNCVFILGIDAQVVASAMETVYRDAVGEDEGEKDDIKGNLGWRFLDKFIQLSFVMPRLSETQRKAFLASLIGGAEEAPAGEAKGDLADRAQHVRRDLAAGRIGTEQATRRVGALTEDGSPLDQGLRQVAEDVIALGARDFSDSAPEAVESLRRRIDYLSDNPRTIKRAVNLYRFYRFIAWARQASASDLDAADPDLIASWTVIAARWPQIVHWLQAEARTHHDPEQILRKTWEGDEPELCRFLTDESGLDLRKAMDCGLW